MNSESGKHKIGSDSSKSLGAYGRTKLYTCTDISSDY